MTRTEILRALDAIIEEAQVGVLATCTGEGRPAMRWMTPTLVRGRPGCLYAVAAPQSRKIRDIEANSACQWMFQTRDLRRVVTVDGRMTVVDNPQLKSEVLETIGPRLEVFWRVNGRTDFVVLETLVEQVSVFDTMRQSVETVSIAGEDRP